MDYNKLEAAREKFKKAEKTGYYNSRWFAVSDLFDALLEPAEPKEIFQEVPHRAECAFCLDESGSYTCIRPAHPAYQAKGDGSIDRATDGRITKEPSNLTDRVTSDDYEEYIDHLTNSLYRALAEINDSKPALDPADDSDEQIRVIKRIYENRSQRSSRRKGIRD